MKSKKEILSDFYAVLWELESGSVLEESSFWEYLTAKLYVYNDILGDDVPEEYWEQVEKYL